MGMLSAAIGAGAGAAADQAKGLIDAETRVNAEKELMAAREQMQRRLGEAQEQRRRGGAAYDFEQAGKNQPEVLKREDLAGRAKGARDTELTLGRQAAESDLARRELPANAEAAADPRVLKATQAAADAKESTSTKAEKAARAKLYSEGGPGAAAARVRVGKEGDEKTALATVDRLNRTAKALEDSGDIESARALREKAQQTLEGIGQRQEAAGKGAAPKAYPPAPQAHADLLNKRLRENPKDARLIISAFEKAYGPGSADALIE